MKNKLVSYYELLGMIKDGNIPKKVIYKSRTYIWSENRRYREENGDLFLTDMDEDEMFDKCIEIPNDDFEDIENIPFNNGMKEFADVYCELEKYNYKINDLINNQKKIINILKSK